MISFLMNVGIGVGYALIGIAIARSQAVRVYRWRLQENTRMWTSGDMARGCANSEARQALAFIAFFWPLALVVGGVLAMSGFVMAPVSQRKDKAAQLRAEAQVWRDQARDELDPSKRAMAEQLADINDERAKEVDL